MLGCCDFSVCGDFVQAQLPNTPLVCPHPEGNCPSPERRSEERKTPTTSTMTFRLMTVGVESVGELVYTPLVIRHSANPNLAVVVVGNGNVA